MEGALESFSMWECFKIRGFGYFRIHIFLKLSPKNPQLETAPSLARIVQTQGCRTSGGPEIWYCERGLKSAPFFCLKKVPKNGEKRALLKFKKKREISTVQSITKKLYWDSGRGLRLTKFLFATHRSFLAT